MGLFPDLEIRTDQDLIQFLEHARKLGIAGHDELDEVAGLIRMKIERYGRRHGLSPMKARFWGRNVALPIIRSADSLLTVANYAKAGKNRFEAFVIAIDDDNAGRSDFEIQARKRKP